MVEEYMKGLGCPYCGSENIWLEKINISPDNPAIVDAHIHCADCKREDLSGCRTDYIIWFLYRLIPDIYTGRSKLSVMRKDDGGDAA